MNNNNRGKAGVMTSMVTLILVTVGLSVYFTVNSKWSVGTVVVIALLSISSGFYFWLWKFYIK